MSATTAGDLGQPPAPARGGSSATWFVVPLLLAVSVIVFYPIAIILVRAIAPEGRLDWALWASTLTAPGLLAAVRNTAILAATTTCLAVPIGVFFAWLIERTDARWGSLSRLLPVIPLLLPPVAMAIGWLFLADPRAGFLARPLIDALQALGLPLDADQVAIQSWAGLIFLYVLWAVPHVYVIAAAAFSGLDPSLEEAARICGKGRMRCFLGVSLPAIRHAVGSSVLVCVISSIGLYSIAALIGSAARIEVLSVYIYRLLNFSYPPRTSQAVIIGLLLMVLIASIWLLQRRIASRTGHAQIGGMGIRPNLLALGGWRWPARLAVLLYVLLTSVLPLLALVVVALQPFWRSRIVLSDLSLGNFAEFGASAAARSAISNSAMLAICASTAAVLAAGLVAVIARHAGGRREQTLGIVTKVPTAIPHIVFAVGVLVAFGFAPFHLGGTWLILFLAYAAIYLPTASIAAESSVQQVGNQLTEAARLFGASPVRTFRTVQLPLILPGLAAGWASIFALVLGELNAAAILSGPRNPVIGYLILTLFDNGTYSQLAAIGSIIGVVSAVAVSAVLLLGRPRFARSAPRGG
ncbi:MAG: ABC transporter permease subunit [Pigmentiphaga sp.]|uniref:ABC transporter permease n=1 Tax=Pigmentiphaga sp. TaxID=1977564 RepID=UPI0029B2B92D|nr:ABC transporter permease subunit [Pigmentiphaga sp.]MDX3905924.1 ABC transporter permease subunit [Pigmentiphaga sp.]